MVYNKTQDLPSVPLDQLETFAQNIGQSVVTKLLLGVLKPSSNEASACDRELDIRP